jgi:Tfp pilus assembly protein PilW
MDFKITSTKSRARHRAAFTLVEAMIAIGITGMLIAAVCTLSAFSARNFAALINYVDLDDANLLAVDQFTRDIREANLVTAFTTNSITVQDYDGFSLSYTNDPTAKTLVRVKNGVSKVLLTGCDSLAFAIGARNVVSNSYEVFDSASPSNAKVVNVSWTCSRSLFGKKAASESVQTARIVIRKQGN